jgi:hypothetical protein
MKALHYKPESHTVIQVTAAKFKLLIFSVWGFALSNIAYIFIFVIIRRK